MADKSIPDLTPSSEAIGLMLFENSNAGASESVTGDQLKGFINLATSHTVAEVSALVGSFVQGQFFYITNAYSATASILMQAIESGALAPYGNGFYQNAAMSTPVKCKVEYDLTTDTIFSIYEPTGKNFIFNSKGTSDCLETFPFDNSLFRRNNIGNFDLTLNDGSSGMFEVTGDGHNEQNGNNCSIVLDNASFLTGNIKRATNIDLGSTSSCTFYNVTFGENCDITFTDGAILSNCEFGSDYVINCTITGYTASNKSIKDGVSTFIYTSVVDVDPLNGNVLDLTNIDGAGLNVTWCGIFTGFTSLTNSYSRIEGFAAIDIKYLFYADGTATLAWRNTSGVFTEGGFDVNLTALGDCIELIPNIKLGAGNYNQGGNTFTQ